MDGKWSCGIILYVLLAGTLPFNDSNLSNLSLKVYKFGCSPWYVSTWAKLIYLAINRTFVTYLCLVLNGGCLCQIHKAELDFSSTFPTEPRELIRKLLDPNPKTVRVYFFTWFSCLFLLFLTYVYFLCMFWMTALDYSRGIWEWMVQGWGVARDRDIWWTSIVPCHWWRCKNQLALH